MPIVTGRLTGRPLIVTGAAAQGIGAVYAQALAAEGALVSLCDVHAPDSTIEAIRGAGGSAIGSARRCHVAGRGVGTRHADA